MFVIEDLEDGTYAIMRVEGRNARTLYLAYSSKDASELIESLEFSELMSKGVPKELVDGQANHHVGTSRHARKTSCGKDSPSKTRRG